MSKSNLTFAEIPQFTQWGNYSGNCPWDYLETMLQNFEDEYGFEMTPDFQRPHRWDDEKRRRYVEFRLRGGKSGDNIVFNCASWNSAESEPVQLVDGLQRLTAVLKFLRDEIRVFRDLDPSQNGYLRSEIQGSLRSCEGARFTFHMNCLKSREEVLQWYLDLNAGGVVHSEEDLDHVRKLLEAEKKK